MEEGKRSNEGKPRVALVPGALKRACARALMYGAALYGQDNWRNGGSKFSYLFLCDSLERHIDSLKEGIDFDEESGLHQIDHIATNVAFLAELIESGKIVDDRYKEAIPGMEENADKYVKSHISEPATPAPGLDKYLEKELKEQKRLYIEKVLDEKRIKYYNEHKLPLKEDNTEGING